MNDPGPVQCTKRKDKFSKDEGRILLRQWPWLHKGVTPSAGGRRQATAPPVPTPAGGGGAMRSKRSPPVQSCVTIVSRWRPVAGTTSSWACEKAGLRRATTGLPTRDAQRTAKNLRRLSLGSRFTRWCTSISLNSSRSNAGYLSGCIIFRATVVPVLRSVPRRTVAYPPLPRIGPTSYPAESIARGALPFSVFAPAFLRNTHHQSSFRELDTPCEGRRVLRSTFNNNLDKKTKKMKFHQDLHVERSCELSTLALD